jgi:hypothetical protein
MAEIAMVYRFEKILLIALITVFGVFPLIAYPVFNSMAPKAASGPPETAYTYKHPVVYQLAEIRYYPLLASALFLAASITLWLKQENPLRPSKLLFAAAFGVMGFSFFRFIVFHGFRTRLVWMDFWEEITEFFYIAVVVAILSYFRRSFFKRQATSDPAI